MGPEYILLDGDKEVYENNTYHKTYYGLRWDLTKWDQRGGRKLAWFVVKEIEEIFERDAVVTLQKIK
jgi:hypothetical protein